MALFIRISVLLLLFTSITFSSHSQVYDGQLDKKMFLGFASVGGSPGIDLKFEDGLTDYLSMGWCFQYLLTNSDKVYDEFPIVDKFIEKFEPGICFNGHFFQSLITSANVDLYAGGYISFKSLALQTGVKYNFSERLGVYGQMQQGLSNSAFGKGGDILNRYGTRLTITGGLTYNFY
jgi:hypothetical protein